MKRLIYIITFILMSGIWLSSCRSIQYVPVDTIKTEYKYIDRIQHDSIYQKDSVMYYVKGDTVFVDKYKYLYKYLFINKVDSFVKVDSIQVPYPVEKQLTRWQSLKMDIGGIALTVVAIIVIIALGKMIYKLKKGG